MKDIFEAPKAEIVLFTSEDVITTSDAFKPETPDAEL